MRMRIRKGSITKQDSLRKSEVCDKQRMNQNVAYSHVKKSKEQTNHQATNMK